MDWIAVLWCFTLLCLAGVVNADPVSITQPRSDKIANKTTAEAVNEAVIAANLDRYSWSQEPDDGSFNFDDQDYPSLIITNATELSAGVYTINVTAHGMDGTSDIRIIIFNVTNAHTETNQHAPVFEALQGQIYMVEWEDKGASVLQVTATDADEASPDNEITYSIAGDDFSINSTTGLVTLQTKLNYTVKAEYELVITATDGGTPPKSASFTETASVQTRPRWLSPDPDQNVSIAINETYSHQFIQIYSLSATDDDNSGVLNYTLLSQEPNTTVKFVVEGDTVNTNPNVTFDIDVDDPVPSYSLTLRVQDEQFTADTVLKVLVVGFNQHRPNFTQDEYRATIDRKYPLHAIILQVNATDPDNKRESRNLSADNSQLVNSKVTYTLLNGSEIFYLHPIYGTLALRQRPNGTEYSLTIIASDDDTPPKLSYAAVIIQVTDEPSYIGLAFGIVGAVAVLIAAVGIGSCVYMSKKAKHWDKKLLTDETLKSKTKAIKKDGSLRFTEVK